MTEVLKAGVLSDEIDLGALAHNAAEQAEEFVRKVKDTWTSNIIIMRNFSLNNGKKLTIAIRINLRYNLILLINKFHNFKAGDVICRCGKHHGNSVTLGIYQDGCKIMISYTLVTGRHYPRFMLVSKAFFEFIQKLAISGHIY